MANFKQDNIRQQTLLNVDFLKVLGTHTVEFNLYQLLEREELLNAFIAQYKNHHSGRKAYPPAMLLRIIFFAYYRGITSSRVIESLCKTDLKFMALAGGEPPPLHHNRELCECLSRSDSGGLSTDTVDLRRKWADR